MSESKIQLKSSCVFDVPLKTYEKDFTFIVNGKKYKTSRLISDLISPHICKIHLNDPTSDTFTFNTTYKGDFSLILDLLSFNEISILPSEVPFFREVIEILGNNSVEYKDPEEITTKNVFSLISQHEKYDKFFSKSLSDEIDLISLHFLELCETKQEELKTLSIETLEKILINDQLQLKSEDQLLNFINELYKSDSKFAILYETVIFENVSSEMMKEFMRTFDKEDMSGEIWYLLSKRLENDGEHSGIKTRYFQQKEFYFNGKNEFKGIVNFLREQSKGNIENEIAITASSTFPNESNYFPIFVTLFDDQNKWFLSTEEQDSWLCFDFKDRRVNPTGYTLRSQNYGDGSCHPKSWVIECSNDQSSWEKIDEENDCSYLNGSNLVHTFTMNKPTSKEFRYLRMRTTGKNWYDNYQLKVDSFEIYGKLV